MPGEDFLTQLLTTPGGVLVLAQSMIVSVALMLLAVSIARQPKKSENGHSNGNGSGVAVAKDAMALQQEYIESLQQTINKMFERDTQIVTGFNALTVAVNAHMEHDTARRTLHEMNGLKIEQQSQLIVAVQKELESFGQYNIRAVQSGAAREIAFSNLVESVQSGQGVMIGLLQEIRDYLRNPNGTPTDTLNHKQPLPMPSADAGASDAAKLPGEEAA